MVTYGTQLAAAQESYDNLMEKVAYYEELKQQEVEKKETLNALFYAKYSRYIQEGSWVDENYTDDNLYFYDVQCICC